MVPTPPTPHTTLVLSPPPSFADFKFTIIGQPQLLKRLATPAPDFRASPTPFHMELQYPSRANTPLTPAIPSLLHRLEIADHATDSASFRNMFVPRNSVDHMAVDEKPALDSVATPSLSRLDSTRAVLNPEECLFRPTRSSPVPIASHLHDYNASLDPEAAINAPTTFFQPGLPPVVASSSTTPYHTTASRPTTHWNSAPIHLTTFQRSSQDLLQTQSSLAFSYESALLTFERAERTFALAQETYEAAKASLAAAANAREHFLAAVAPTLDGEVPPAGERGTATSTWSAQDSMEGEAHSAATNQHRAIPPEELRNKRSHSPSNLSVAATRSINRPVIELEREANDARLAWSLDSVARLSSLSITGPDALVPEADILAEEDPAPEPEPITAPHHRVPVEQLASSSQAPIRASETLAPSLSNPAPKSPPPEDGPHQHQVYDNGLHLSLHSPSSSSHLRQITASLNPSPKPTTQPDPQCASPSVSSINRFAENTDDDDSNMENDTRTPDPNTDPPSARQLSAVSDTNHIASHPSTVTSSSATPVSPGSRVPSVSGEGLHNQESESAFPSALADVNDDHDSRDNAPNLKLEDDFASNPWTISETRLPHNHGLSVKDEGDENWQMDQERNTPVSSHPSVVLEVNRPRARGASAVPSSPLSAHSTRSTPLEPIDEQGPVSTETHNAADGQEIASDTVTSTPHTPDTSRPDAHEYLQAVDEGRPEANGDTNTEKIIEEVIKDLRPSNPQSRKPALEDRISNQRGTHQKNAPLSSGGTLLQRLQPTPEHASRLGPNTMATTSEPCSDTLRTPSPVTLGKRRRADDQSSTSPPSPHKRHVPTTRRNPAPSSRSDGHHPTNHISAHNRPGVYHRRASPSRPTYNSYVPKNGYSHVGARPIPSSDKPRKAGEGVRLGVHRLVDAGVSDRRAPQSVPGAEGRNRGGMSLADRLSDPLRVRG